MILDFLEVKSFAIKKQDWLNDKDLVLGLILPSIFINILALIFPMSLLQIYDRIIPNNSFETLKLLMIGVVIAIILEMILRIFRSYVGAWVDARFNQKIGGKAFDKILFARINTFTKYGTGVQIERLNSLNSIRNFYGGQLITTLLDIPFVVIFLFLITYLAGPLVLIPLIIIASIAAITLYIIKYSSENLSSTLSVNDRRMNFIVELISGIHTVKAFGFEAQMIRRYERLLAQSSRKSYQRNIINNTLVRFVQFATHINLVAIVGFGSMMVINGHLTLGAVAASTLLVTRLLQPMTRSATLIFRIKNIQLSIEGLKELLKIPPEYAENSEVVEKVKGEIEFQDVSFRYDENSDYIFENVSFTIKPGEAIYIKGIGNSGRSTLLGLIGGLYLPTSGKILVDGKDMTTLDLSSYRKHVGYLPEEGELFNGNVLDNITIFRPEEYTRRALAIAELVGLNEVIQYMPDGYFTMVGRSAVDAVPLGIRQRIAIARALIEYPSIILFDSANSALDSHGDSTLMKAMNKLKGQCTIILATHRPSTAELADRTFIIKDGKIEEKLT